jgi:osmotically-inducible protein OsmY
MQRSSDEVTVMEGVAEYPPQFATATSSTVFGARSIERAVQRELLLIEGLHFTTLTVRRLNHDTVCLQGVVEVDGPCPDLTSVARRVDGIRKVMNHVVAVPAGRSKFVPREDFQLPLG